MFLIALRRTTSCRPPFVIIVALCCMDCLDKDSSANVSILIFLRTDAHTPTPPHSHKTLFQPLSLARSASLISNAFAQFQRTLIIVAPKIARIYAFARVQQWIYLQISVATKLVASRRARARSTLVLSKRESRRASIAAHKTHLWLRYF